MARRHNHVTGACGDALPINDTHKPGAHGLADLLRHLELEASRQACLDDRAGEHMMRGLLERRAEHQHALDRFAGRDVDGEQPCATDRQRPGLVEQHGMGARQRFQRAAALDENAAPCGLRNAGDEGDRRGQDQRTRRRGHQHGEATGQIVRDQPGNQGNDERYRQENQRIAIGKPDEWRLCGLRRRHQPHDAGIGAGTRFRRRRQFEGLPGIQRAGEQGHATRLADRDGLAGQRGFVDRRCSRYDDTIDRNDLAGPDHQQVADRDCGYRHVLDVVIAPSVSLARRAVDQRTQIMLGSRHRNILEHVAAGIHQRHDGPGQRLTERDGRAHRDQRNGVDPETAGQEVAEH